MEIPSTVKRGLEDQDEDAMQEEPSPPTGTGVQGSSSKRVREDDDQGDAERLTPEEGEQDVTMGYMSSGRPMTHEQKIARDMDKLIDTEYISILRSISAKGGIRINTRGSCAQFMMWPKSSHPREPRHGRGHEDCEEDGVWTYRLDAQ